jgi:hypothetical protein
MRRLPPLFGLVLLSACLPEFPDRKFTEDPTNDFDGDGFTELEGDCDDGEPLAYPGGEERCDGIDNDCDGDADEDDAVDALTWYSDEDRDGYGTATFVVTACEPPSEAYAAEAGDCDDLLPSINPGAQETCAPYDEDCDGTINEGQDDGTLIDTDTWYKDADSDGYGTDSDTIQQCDRPNGYVLDGGDCDDANRFVSPSAPEVCDGLDNDCDDLTDDDDPGMTGEGTWYPDTDGDGFGDPDGEVVVQCTEPDGHALDSSDCDDTNPTANPDEIERCNGVDDNCNGVTDEHLTLTAYEDADGDGYGADDAEPTEVCTFGAGYAESPSDCDDTKAYVNPEGVEICNELDDNCDGRTDEGVTIFAYIDDDGDGHGAIGTTPAELCTITTGYAATATDCDDSTSLRHPELTEICNGIDDNCDGRIDEGLTLTAYADEDGDGYGAIGASPEIVCEIGPGHSATATDCDDSTSLRHPGLIEVCNGIDDNCDDQIDEDLTLTAYADEDGDGHGSVDASPEIVCEIGPGLSATATDCDDSTPLRHPGLIEVCNGIDDNCDDQIDEDLTLTAYADEDGDGHGSVDASPEIVCEIVPGLSATATDCDDTAEAVFPGNPETCNETDDDCDGVIDEGVTLAFYRDFDDDGFGDALSPLEACSLPEGYVVNWTDCDDSLDTVFPEADEYCDGLDNDCDDLTDESDALDAPTWYLDADDDGYGNDEVSLTSCATVPGYAATGGDCNDGRDNVHPGVESETCFTAYDDNCDDDNNDVDAIGCITHYRDEDGDGHGVEDDSLCVCEDRDVYQTINTGDCDDSLPEVNVDAWESCATAYDDDCDGDDNDLNALGCTSGFYDFDGDGYGTASTVCLCELSDPYSASVPGDCNDGDDSVHPGAEEGCGLYGEVGTDQISASTERTGRLSKGEYTFRISGLGGFGPAGDVTEDANDDLLIGNYDYDQPTPEGSISNAGAALIFAGPTLGTLDLSSTTSANVRITGVLADSWCGSKVAGLGDVSGDGHADVAVLCPGVEMAYIFHGPLEGDYTVDEADAWFPSVSRLVVAGDLNGDGSPEIFGDQPDFTCADTDFDTTTSPIRVDDSIRSQCHDLVAYPAGHTGLLSDVEATRIRAYTGLSGVQHLECTECYYGGLEYPSYGPLHAGWSYGDVEFPSRNSSVATADFDGDGFGDVVTAYPPTDMVMLYSGASISMGSSYNDPDGGWALEGTSMDDITSRGIVVKASNDFDGDGYPELVISSPMASPYDSLRGYSEQGGMVEVVTAPFESWPTNLSEQATTTFVGDADNQWVGLSFDLPGDINGDGDDDILIMSSHTDQAHPTRIFYGGFDEGTVDFSDAEVLFNSEYEPSPSSSSMRTVYETLLDQLHDGVAGVGDLNGDGYQDFGVHEFVDQTRPSETINYNTYQFSLYYGLPTD